MTVFLVFSASAALSRSTFSGSRLAAALENYVRSLIDGKTEVFFYKKIKSQSFPEDGVIAKCVGDARSLRGARSLAIEFYDGDRLLKRISVPARIKIYKKAVAAAKNIEEGKKIEATDLRIVEKEVSNCPNVAVSASQLIGKRAARRIRRGEPISLNDALDDVFVKRGDKVTIVAQAGAIRIRSVGTALQDATAGSSIKVKREGTRTILTGLLAKDGSVYIIGEGSGK